MTIEEAKKVTDSFKKQGVTDNELIYALTMMYCDNHLSYPELCTLLQINGYELIDELDNLSDDMRKTLLKSQYQAPTKPNTENLKGKKFTYKSK